MGAKAAKGRGGARSRGRHWRGGARSRGRHCPDCGAAMLYYPHLSSAGAPGGRRVLVYSCPECTDDFDRPRMVAVRRASGGARAGAGEAGGGVVDGIESVDVEIVERVTRMPGTPKPGAGRARQAARPGPRPGARNATAR